MTEYIPPPSSLSPGSLVWAYLRDSGGGAQEQSVSQQRDVITTYCRQHGLVIIHIFADEAKTGTTDKKRDMFAELIDHTARADNRPKGLLIWSLSRFCRNQDDGPYYRALLRKRGIVIHSLTEALPTEPVGIVIEAVYDFTNAEKSRQASRDVKRGHVWLIRQGYAPGGTPPTGYKAIREVIGKKRDGSDRIAPRWVEDPERWELGKQAWAAFADGASFSDLHRLTTGKFFSSRVHWSHFFRNRAYLGILFWGGEEYPDHHPAMIDRATWDRVHARLKAYEERMRQGNPDHPRRLHAPSLLSGIAVCALCGSAMCYRVHHPYTRPWPHYVCGRKVSDSGAACPAKRVMTRYADQAILRGVIGQVFTDDMIADLIAEVKKQLADTEKLDRAAGQLDRPIADCKRSIGNLLDLAKVFGSLAAKDELLKCESELARLQGERRKVDEQRQAADIDVTPEAIRAVLEQWQDDLVKARQSGSIQAMKRLLSRFVIRIELGYYHAKVYYSFPMGDHADTLISLK